MALKDDESTVIQKLGIDNAELKAGAEVGTKRKQRKRNKYENQIDYWY